MLTVALKGIAGRKVRALLTAIAIVLGVAMISGTYILTDTINNGFNTIVTNSYKNADVVISGEAAFKNTNGNGVETPTFPQNVLTKVRALPDVEAAAGAVQSDNVKLIGKNGKVIDTGGAPSLGFSIDPTKPRSRASPLASETSCLRTWNSEPSSPQRPTAGCPWRFKRSTMSLLSLPTSTIFATSTVCSFETRRP